MVMGQLTWQLSLPGYKQTPYKISFTESSITFSQWYFMT